MLTFSISSSNPDPLNPFNSEIAFTNFFISAIASEDSACDSCFKLSGKSLIFSAAAESDPTRESKAADMSPACLPNESIGVGSAIYYSTLFCTIGTVFMEGTMPGGGSTCLFSVFVLISYALGLICLLICS